MRLLGLMFERPRGGWAEQVRSLAAEQGDERLRALAYSALGATEGAYLRAFGPGGTVSPREVAYRRLADPGRMLADLSAFYEAFAYRPRAEDPADHIAVELGFAGYLAMKQAYTLTSGDRAGARRTREARALLRETRLRPFAAGLRARLAVDAPSHLEAAARLLAEWAGCAEGAAEPGFQGGAWNQGDDADAMPCGGCGAAEPEAEGERRR